MSGKKHIKTWVERCEEHPDHNGIVSERMIKARMQEEIDELREENERLREALTYDWDQLEACRESLREHMVEIKRLREALEMIAGHRPCVIDGFKRGFMPGAEIAKAALRREDEK